MSVHVVVREEDGAWGAWSPTLPGLSVAGSSPAELRELLPPAVVWWAGEIGIAGELQIIIHVEQTLLDMPLVLRVAQDRHLEDRREVGKRVLRSLTVPEQVDAHLLHSRESLSSSGEPIIVAAVPADSLQWLTEQMDGPQDHLLVAASVADEHLIIFHVTNGLADVPGMAKHDHLSKTVGEVLQAITIHSPTRDMEILKEAVALPQSKPLSTERLGRDERVSLALLDPEVALRALLKTQPG